MQRLHINQGGFGHHVLFGVILVGVIGLLVFTGKKVVEQNQPQKADQQTSIAPETMATEPVATPDTVPSTSGSGSVSVKKVGTAAAVATPASPKAPIKSQQSIKTAQDILTPKGSFVAMLDELKAGRYLNVLYFMTPNFMNNSAELLKSIGNVNADTCRENTACNVLLNTPTDKLGEAAIGAYETGNLSEEGTSLTYTVQLGAGLYEGQPESDNGMHKIRIDMIKGETNWLIDRVSLDNTAL